MKIRKIVVFLLAVTLLIGANSFHIDSAASNSANALKIVHTFTDGVLKSIIWDGKQYVGVGGNAVYTSTDGLNWEKHELKSLEADQIAYNGSVYAIAGDFSNGRPTTGMSKNGTDWTTVTGGKTSWSPPTRLISYKNKFFLYLGDKVYVSSDGIKYLETAVGVTDPYKLTPKGYQYLKGKGESSLDPQTVVSDGKYIYATETDYYGLSILRSLDGITWEIVHFNKDKYLYSLEMQFVIGNGKYLITCNKNKVFVSSNGKDWSLQDTARKDMSRILKDSTNVHEYIYNPPQVYNFKGVYLAQCYYTKNKIDVSTDFRNFYEYAVEQDITDILFMDDKYIITEKYVIDYSAIKAGLADGFKNGVKSSGKNASASGSNVVSPSTTTKKIVKINRLKEFKYPYIFSSVIWDGSKYVGVGGYDGNGGCVYTSKDGKTWDIAELNMYTPCKIAYNGSIYTITGGQYHNVMGVATSKNAKDWTIITGKMNSGVGNVTVYASTLIWFKERLLHIKEVGLEMSVSEDGAHFKTETVQVSDPQNLASGALLERYFSIYSIVTYDSYLYANCVYYRKPAIIRSSDGIHWEVVYYDKNGDRLGNILNCDDHLTDFCGEYMLVSSDGTNWSKQPSIVKNFNVKDANGNALKGSVSFHNGYWMFLPNIVRYEETIKAGKIYLSKDMKSFTEYDIEERNYDFEYVDEKIMVADDKVYDSKVIKEFSQ
ncbi:MAG TPA: hypothetical protein VHT96_14780 [Clostridia bacterium]|nr:hypothetical protein [Clostridia bacterium]